MKAVVVIPVHCDPEVIKLNLGTLLNLYDGSYEMEIVLSVHQNYHHYSDKIDEIKSLPVKLTYTNEIDWFNFNEKDLNFLLRYSKMHAKSLLSLLECISNLQFDKLIVFDHDLIHLKDFVKFSLQKDQDMIGSYLGDRNGYTTFKTHFGPILDVAPKFSVWHMALSRRFVSRLMDDPSLVVPLVRDGRMFDTFSCVLEAPWIKDMKQLILLQEEMRSFIFHVGSMSFNYGPYETGKPLYQRRLADCSARYRTLFPNGINHLFDKLKH